MTLSRYLDRRKWVLAKAYRLHILKLFYVGLPAFIYILYPLTLVLLLWQRNMLFLPVLFVPLAGFLSVTYLRRWCNAPRPYEVYGLPPLVSKNTRGLSFPSRHCACAAVIAVSLWKVSWAMGLACGIAALVIAACRVLAGVHFPRDVIAGLALGGMIGLVGMWCFSLFL